MCNPSDGKVQDYKPCIEETLAKQRELMKDAQKEAVYREGICIGIEMAIDVIRGGNNGI